MKLDQDEGYLENHRRWAAMRSEPGLPSGPRGFRLVTRHAGVSQALQDVDVFVGSAGYNADLPEEEQILPSIPEPRHGLIRRVINGVIAPHRLRPVEPYVRELTRETLGRIATGDALDVVPTLVDPIPARAMTFTFGIADRDADTFRRMSDEMLDNQTAMATGGIGSIHPEFTKLPQLDELRLLLDAEIGCTRKVTDAGWMPHARQIGITGRSIAPQLFVSIGASGKFNHMVGVRAAGSILAINPDPNALVWEHCDVGIVADWQACVPMLVEQLRETLPRVAIV